MKYLSLSLRVELSPNPLPFAEITKLRYNVLRINMKGAFYDSEGKC